MQRSTGDSTSARVRPIRVLFIVPYPKDCAPSQRLKFEQHLSYLRQHGIAYDFSPFVNPALWEVLYAKGHLAKKVLYTLLGYVRRIWDVLRCRRYDMIYLHLEAAPFGPPIFEWLFHRRGVPIVYDIDDLIYLPRESPANPLVKFFRSYDKIPTIIRMSDRVVVVTKYLVEYTKKFNPNVVFIPPTINADVYTPKRNYQKKQVCIGWTGSYSTSKYLLLLTDVLKEISQRYEVKIKVIGDEHFRIPGLNIEAKKWELGKEVEDISEIDIGLYPLPKNEWVLGKGGLKALQYMGMGIPTICTAYGAALEIIRDGENGFLANTEREWVEKLSKLIGDIALREKLGRNGRKTVEEGYSVLVHSPVYLEVIRHVARPRIFHLISDLDIGGTEKMLAELVKHADKGQYAIFVCSVKPYGEVAKEIRLVHGVQLLSLNVRTKLDFFVFFKLYRLLRRKRVSILQTYLFFDNVLGRIVGKAAHVPIIISGQRYLYKGEPRWRIYLDKITAGLADLIVANSKAAKQSLIEHSIGKGKIQVIYNGKDFTSADAIRPAAALAELTQNHPLVGIVARLNKIKGHAYFLEAARMVLNKIPEVRFLVVGDGPLRKKLEKQTAELGISHAVHFLGNQEEILPLVACFDVSVLSSLAESFPGALLESMGMGKPVVATRVGGIPEMVADGKTGYLVSPRDPEQLAEKITLLLQNEQQREEFGKTAKAVVRKKFSHREMIRSYEKVYHTLLKKRLPR